MSDPMEVMVLKALHASGEPFEHGPAVEAHLDFHLPNRGVHIEVKQFHSDRIAAQMARVENVIVAQGAKAVGYLASLLSFSSVAPTAGAVELKTSAERRAFLRTCAADGTLKEYRHNLLSAFDDIDTLEASMNGKEPWASNARLNAEVDRLRAALAAATSVRPPEGEGDYSREDYGRLHAQLVEKTASLAASEAKLAETVAETYRACAHIADGTPGWMQPRDVARAIREASFRPAENAGEIDWRDWQIVPKRPTEEMLQAACGHRGSAKRTYLSMLAAAPAPPTELAPAGTSSEDQCALCGERRDNGLLTDICRDCEARAPWRDPAGTSSEERADG